MKVQSQLLPFPKARSYDPLEEPPDMRGLLFQQNPDGKVTILARSGQTDPDSPPDIPSEAVHDNRVFISVDGIGQDWTRHREQISDWFQGGAEYGVDLGGPVIGIHEGEGKNTLSDSWRILKNVVALKKLQIGGERSEDFRQSVYANDPSVKTVYDQLTQSLKAGREVTFMAHSGGAAQVALALALYAADAKHGREKIAAGVRVLGTAPAASFEDFTSVGVREENVLVTGSTRDPVFQMFRNFWTPQKPFSLLPSVARTLWSGGRFLLQPGPYHQGEHIFQHHQKDGSHRLGEFLAGGPGGRYPFVPGGLGVSRSRSSSVPNFLSGPALEMTNLDLD